MAASGPQQQSYEAVTSITAHEAQSIYCHLMCALRAVGSTGRVKTGCNSFRDSQNQTETSSSKLTSSLTPGKRIKSKGDRVIN